MDETWESLFIKQAKELKHSDKFIKVCLDYARNLHAHNLPVIFDHAHLAQYLTISPEKLKYAIDNSVRLYKSFELKKASNKGTRKINAPFPSLKVIQNGLTSTFFAVTRISFLVAMLSCHKTCLERETYFQTLHLMQDAYGC